MDSFKYRLSKMAQEVKKKRSEKDIKILENYDVPGLKELILQIESLGTSNTYENLYKSFNLRGKIIAPKTKVNTLKNQSSLIKIAKDNLDNFPVYIPSFTDLIDYKTFCVMYTFLESIYYMNLGKKLETPNLKQLYSNGLDERIILTLDKFNDTSNVSKPTESFFLKLKNTKWSDEETKRFFKDLHEAMISIGAEIFGCSLNRFRVTENAFLLFLAGCSAVNNNRDKITPEDTIIAYKTYFKLIKTDITKYTAHLEHSSENGYLVCDKCNEYYKLRPGEFPEDFINECKCGGNLRFIKDLKEQI